MELERVSWEGPGGGEFARLCGWSGVRLGRELRFPGRPARVRFDKRTKKFTAPALVRAGRGHK